MKKYIIAVFILAVLASCEDFLHEEPVGTQTYSYYETAAGIELLINACYECLRYKAGNENSYGFHNYGTDEYTKGAEWSQPYAQDEFNDYTPELNSADKPSGQADLNDMWIYNYNAIDRCNVAIDKIPKVETDVGFLKDQEGKDIRMGEVRFLRAYYYFMLVQQFGAIPLTLEPSSGLELEWPRVPVAQIYETIIEDLLFAVEKCPLTQTDYGRVTKNAARHYLAKVYLTRACSTVDDVNDRNFYKGGNRTEDLTAAANLIDDIEESGTNSLVPDYADLFKEGNEVNSEILFAIQFNDVVGLNGADGSQLKNELHEFWMNQYDVSDPGMARNIEYGRPFRRLFITDYTVDINDRLNDSRLRKSLLEVYYSTATNQASVSKWTNEELLFAFSDVAPDGSWAVRYGDTIRAGDYKFNCATAIPESEHVVVGDTALLFLVNDKNTTLTDRQMIAAGYKIYARYYWSTNADGSLNELVTYDRNDDMLFSSNAPVVNSTTIQVSTWNRNKAPSLIKYWDRNKPAGYNSHVGTRDVFLARLGETYLIGAEAYGRLGNYDKAAEYINKLRKRAAYKEGEEKPNFWWKYDGGTYADRTASTEAALLIPSTYWDDDSKDDVELYPPSVDTKEERFVHFILNERCREMLGEMVRWEDLVRTETLLERAMLFNDDTRNTNRLSHYHMVRPLPQAHIDGIQTQGRNLTPQEKIQYQNEGYD